MTTELLEIRGEFAQSGPELKRMSIVAVRPVRIPVRVPVGRPAGGKKEIPVDTTTTTTTTTNTTNGGGGGGARVSRDATPVRRQMCSCHGAHYLAAQRGVG